MCDKVRHGTNVVVRRLADSDAQRTIWAGGKTTMTRFTYFFCAALVPGALAGTVRTFAVETAAAREIRAVEQQMHEAYVNHDVPTFASLYADDATFTHSNGHVVSKTVRVKEFTGPYSDLKDDVQNVRVYGDIA